jgi:hypothetical protein
MLFMSFAPFLGFSQVEDVPDRLFRQLLFFEGFARGRIGASRESAGASRSKVPASDRRTQAM